MAVIFIPDQTGQQFVIGGQSTVGPFPKYSVSKEVLTSGDGTALGSKYNITINGQFIVDSSVDITVSGARQANYNQKILERLSAMRQYYSTYGRLEISPYGGQPNSLIWNDAKLISVDIPESTDESSSILYADFTFTFEAYTEVSSVGTADGNFSTSIDGYDYDKYYVSSVEETWEVSFDEEVTYTNEELTNEINRTYTFTHNVSATGLRKPLPAGGFDTSAWKEAQRWVISRLATDPQGGIIMKDLMGGDNFTNFWPAWFGTDNGLETGNDTFAILDEYTAYNHTRIPSINIGEGTFSVVETWKVTKSPPATIDVNVDLDIGEDQIVSVSMNGTVQGYDAASLNNTIVDKLSNAQLVFDNMAVNAYYFCNTHYNLLGTGGTLSNVVRSRSIGKNPGTGVITFSFAYNDTPILLDNAIVTDLSIIDDNADYDVDIIAIIPIIAKPNGPIIQDMGTSRERKRTVQLDATMKKDYRSSKPAQGKVVALTYAPVGTTYIQNLTENWNPKTGAYSITVEWTY